MRVVYQWDMKQLKAFALKAWIDAHRAELKPPVGNRRLFRDGDFIVMVVGGPNRRKDFHLGPGEEFFYQLEGDMLLKVFDEGRVVDVPIREGEVFLLPANTPHSPQRYAHTVGLVVERQRRAGERDGLAWYCEACHAELYREEFELTDIETQFPPVFDRFYSSLDHRTCRRCGTVQEPPGGPSPP